MINHDKLQCVQQRNNATTQQRNNATLQQRNKATGRTTKLTIGIIGISQNFPGTIGTIENYWIIGGSKGLYTMTTNIRSR